MRRARVPQDSFETCFLLFPYFTVSFFGSGVCVFKALQFQWNQNCRCERTRIRMLGTRQLRAQLAVGESVRQSVLLHRNLINWVWSKVLRLIYMYMHIWYILWIYVYCIWDFWQTEATHMFWYWPTQQVYFAEGIPFASEFSSCYATNPAPVEVYISDINFFPSCFKTMWKGICT